VPGCGTLVITDRSRKDTRVAEDQKVKSARVIVNRFRKNVFVDFRGARAIDPAASRARAIVASPCAAARAAAAPLRDHRRLR
jgi:hypothetical protein